MKIVEKRMQEVKEKISELTGAEGIEARTELIQQMVPVVLDYVKELLKGDEERIAGLRNSRCGGDDKRMSLEKHYEEYKPTLSCTRLIERKTEKRIYA